jgi:hypothetical protein
MRSKQILLWVLILNVAGMVVVSQPVRSVSASADSSVAALPVSQAFQYGSGIFVTASMGSPCAGVAWYGPVSACTQPYAGEFVVTTLNGAEVARLMTNYLGQVMVDLPPGWYIVGVRTESYYPRAAPVVISVLADRYTNVFFRIDSGAH